MLTSRFWHLAIMLVLISGIHVRAITQSYRYDWIKETHCTGISSSGDIYSVRHYYDGEQLDLLHGVKTLYPLDGFGNSYDILVAKYDSTGRFLWWKSIPYAGNQMLEFATMSSDRMFIYGTFSDSTNLSFDPQAPSVAHSPGPAFFFAVYDTALTLISAFSGPDLTNDVIVKRIHGHANGFVISGSIYGSADLDFGPGTTQVTTSTEDIFVASYDLIGNFQWGRILGTPVNEQFHDFVMGSSGRIFLTGRLVGPQQTVVLGPQTHTLGGNPEGMVLAMDPAGNIVDALLMEVEMNYKGPEGIALGPDGNLYIVGHFLDSLDLSGDGLSDVFAPLPINEQGYLAKLDTALNLLSAKSIENIQKLNHVRYSNKDSVMWAGGAASGSMEMVWFDLQLDTLQTKRYYASQIFEVRNPGFSRSGELFFSGGSTGSVEYEQGPPPLTGASGTCKLTTNCYPLSYLGVSEDSIIVCNQGLLSPGTLYLNTALMGVSATGTGLRYQWIQQGSTVLQDVDNPPLYYAGSQQADLIASAASALPFASFDYQCVLYDGCGNSDSSDIIKVVVLSAPDASLVPSFQHTPPQGQDYVLTVVDSVAMLPLYYWNKGSVMLLDNAKFSGTSTSTLTIHSLSSLDAGLYTCYGTSSDCPSMVYYPYVYHNVIPTGGVGSPEAESGNSVSLVASPNPTTDHVLLVTSCATVKGISLHDAAGKNVKCSVEPLGNGVFKIDLSLLPQGIYWASGFCEGHPFTTTIVKQ